MKDQNGGKKIGIVLMTYGSATTAENVRAYMDHIYRGKADEAIIADFENRYRLVGRSPLVAITEQQAALLERADDRYVVRAGMLHSQPFIEEAVRDCKQAGVERCLAIILSPQFSSFIMDGYRTAFERAGVASGFTKEQMSVASPWPTESHFIELLADTIKTSLNLAGGDMPIVFTTHSLPQRVVEKDPSYLDQLRATTDAVLKKLDDLNLISYSGYQSAGHTPEAWLKPDLTDILAELKQNDVKSVLIVPIQFLTDHLEILYDLDIAARAQCEKFGIAYHRIELPNTNPHFIDALNAIAKRQSAV